MPWKGHQSARSPLQEPPPTSALPSTSSMQGEPINVSQKCCHFLPNCSNLTFLMASCCSSSTQFLKRSSDRVIANATVFCFPSNVFGESEMLSHRPPTSVHVCDIEACRVAAGAILMHIAFPRF